LYTQAWFGVLELFSGQGTHGKIVTRALWHTLKVIDANGGMFRPNVHLLRLDMHDNGNTELVSDVRDWNGDHIGELKDIWKSQRGNTERSGRTGRKCVLI
jgi:hypothetical protein